jgi:oligopeptide transport system permease protein
VTTVDAIARLEEPPERRPSWAGTILRELWRHPRGRIGLVISLAVIAAALIGPLFVPWAPDRVNTQAVVMNDNQAVPPFQQAAHLLGTDILGRDMLARTLVATRVSLVVALVVQVAVIVIGLPVGAVAGWVGGRTETLLMRATDVVAAFPQLIFIIMFQAVFVDTAFARMLDGLFVVFLGIGLLSWVVVARLVRGEVLQLKHRAFVESAVATGVRGRDILTRHVMPNLVGVVVVAISAGIPAAILTESTLSFLGLGIQPPSSSLGSLIWSGVFSHGATLRYMHLLVIPTVPLLLLLVGFTLLGDGLRDVLDPRLRRR